MIKFLFQTSTLTFVQVNPFINNKHYRQNPHPQVVKSVRIALLNRPSR